MGKKDAQRWLRELPGGRKYYSLPALGQSLGVDLGRLPVCLRIVLESVMRNCGTRGIEPKAVESLARWTPDAAGQGEVPFVVSRVLLQDFTGVPLLVDLAAMRDAMADLGKDPKAIEPQVPVDLVVDHSVQVDVFGQTQALERNLKLEFERNKERYTFLKWGQEAFESFRVVPPGRGIVHQVNLEYLASCVFEKKRDEPTASDALLYPDTLVGTDSHTTMINGLGVVGWGVGGIEAEAAMLGQPVYLSMPRVVGVHLTGGLKPGVTATDLTLRITELLRQKGVVGSFVEFIGPGAQALSVADRATVANMAPEYGATMGFFPVDRQTLDYLRLTGRPAQQLERIQTYYTAQGLWELHTPEAHLYNDFISLDLNSITPSVAGPKRPQDRLELPAVWPDFKKRLAQPHEHGGYEQHEQPVASLPEGGELRHGSVVIAAITSCTNTSNPSVMVAAGLLAQAALERGLKVPPWVKTSLAPGSRVVTDYLNRAGLQKPLDALGFHLVGYGCTTCIGNSGPLPEAIETAIHDHHLITASVLSGNRNFEARIHSSVKANYLMSPPLVVAYALAGRITLDFESDPIGHDPKGQPVFLKDLWPRPEAIEAILKKTLTPERFLDKYANISDAALPEWADLPTPASLHYSWDPESTYIQKPPFFENITQQVPPPAIEPTMPFRALAIFGDSVTTDHISPAGAIGPDTPAGQYLQAHGIQQRFFNSYGSRRGNDRIMTRGTFANVRIRNLMAKGKEGGFTLHWPSEELVSIFEAAQRYQKAGTPLLVFAGQDYGMGSSRDWAAKGTQLLGVRAVIASSFERIHRSNLLGFGVLPLEFPPGTDASTLELTGTETFRLQPDFSSNQAQLSIQRPNAEPETLTLRIRLDTPTEHTYYQNGGILPFVLRSFA